MLKTDIETLQGRLSQMSWVCKHGQVAHFAGDFSLSRSSEANLFKARIVNHFALG